MRIQPTYEELKPFIYSCTVPDSKCIQPTYEELKLLSVLRYISSAVTRIQPTYEELKLPVSGNHFANFHRIQPTYEELKQQRFPLILFGYSRIQPTYEELKPTEVSEDVADTAVSSLPMRN